jgi:UDPglucose 6-dehydrogenase
VKICVIGSGYVGLVAAACFAELGHEVVSVDNDAAKVELLRNGRIPIHEDGVSELLKKHGRTHRITFTSDLRLGVREAKAVFVAVGTPQSVNGEANLSYVEAVVQEIASELTSYKVIVEKSTVPVLTNQCIARILKLNGANARNFDVVSNPEFLREGTAVRDFLYPDRIVVGTDSERARCVLRELYAPLVTGEYYKRTNKVNGLNGRCHDRTPARYIETTAESAELIKHASNAFLALKISFINLISNLCETVGTDIEEVAAGIGADRRIGPAFLRAGVGYGGSCFPKDIRAFHHIGESNGCDFSLFESVEKINADQQERFLEKVTEALWTLKGKRLGVLGLAFKGGTDDIRESPAMAIMRELLKRECVLQAYDPAAMDRAREVLAESENMVYVNDPYEAAKGAHALLILTEWPEFGQLELDKLREIMRYPIVVDGRNLYQPKQVAKMGLHYYSMGRPTMASFGESDADRTSAEEQACNWSPSCPETHNRQDAVSIN